MAEVFVEYRTRIVTDDGRAYLPRACGAAAPDGTGRWHGWIEFLPVDGGPPVRTARETTQPNRAATEYWSTGLTQVYLSGALRRALNPLRIPSASGAYATWMTASAGSCDHSQEPRISSTPRAFSAKGRLELTPFDRRFLKWLGISQE